MNNSNSARATRQQAFAAAQRLSSLIQLTQHDPFLHETMQFATAVIARSGIMLEPPQHPDHCRPKSGKRHSMN
jgi:hypothetical protein